MRELGAQLADAYWTMWQGCERDEGPCLPTYRFGLAEMQRMPSVDSGGCVNGFGWIPVIARHVSLALDGGFEVSCRPSC